VLSAGIRTCRASVSIRGSVLRTCAMPAARDSAPGEGRMGAAQGATPALIGDCEPAGFGPPCRRRVPGSSSHVCANALSARLVAIGTGRQEQERPWPPCARPTEHIRTSGRRVHEKGRRSRCGRGLRPWPAHRLK
jgi:hypothetical protein